MKTGNYKARCYESHPPLSVGSGLVIHGGSCGHPIVHDADIYVGFDYTHHKSAKAFPWVPGESFLYPIADMRAPTDPDSFKQLIDWLAVQLTAQKKVHLGCIGGHGRTGTVLAALVAKMMSRQDAIQYVRANYCPKAVESTEQVEFLVKHFGCLTESPTKSHPTFLDTRRPSATPKPLPKPTSSNPLAGATPPSSISVWGLGVTFDKLKKPANIKATEQGGSHGHIIQD